jgi:hypothetical protein
MVLDGIVIPADRLATVNESLQKYRREHRLTAELKWTKVNKKYLGKYTITPAAI